ncbi:hypothetical protein [Vibrio anguillarum]|uniref:hypothetical protein n=1 Tax=Vibrio anguillarum TaxID=55601 RepID=UPI001AD7F0C3|nr:hypothetical protein [Vibrio anguillarum]MBT2931058.1 hypothetical protein [Vibrio anguillarum]
MSSQNEGIDKVKPVMLQMIDLVTPYLEVIYLLSAPVVAYFAYRALEQIRVGKNATKIQSDRESIRLAAERCEYYHKEISPEVVKFFDHLKDKDIDFIDKCEVIIDNDGVSIKAPNDDESLKKLVEEIDCFHELFNRLELFAMYFSGKIANEEFAYHALGITYCKLIKRLMPLLMMNFFKDECKHIITLFYIWNPRVDKLYDSKRKKKLERELSELNKKETPERKLKPLGT